MLARLLKLDARSRRTLLGLSALHVLALIGACSGSPFTASPAVAGNAGDTGAGAGDIGAGGGDAGSGDEAGGANPSGGTGDTGGVAGSGGGISSAGTGGKPTSTCATCGAGMYCQDGTNKCRSCADFSRLEFASAQPLSTLSHTAMSVERFPRSAYNGSSLFYTVGPADSQRLWYSAAPTSGIGVAISAASRDSGPVLAPGFSDKNFFFDRVDVATNLRKLMTANWSAGAISDPTPAGSPVNVPGSSDYSIAVAPNAGHAYWMSTRNGMPQLVWESINESPMLPPGPLDLKLRIGANANCERLGDDATPWVNLAGTLLLFSAESLADTCQPNDSGAHDLFAVPLGKDGKAASAAIALSTLNNTGGGSNETDPSLAQDSCSLYFASDNGTGNYDLYRAARN